jgi:hypothetical protein
MKIKWEKRKVLVPVCSTCKEQLGGNNSYIHPYECKCGIWKSKADDPSEYEIVGYRRTV